VGGPAEIAYLAQGQVLYRALLGRMPTVFPRNSFTLLDARCEKLMDRFGLRLPDLLDHQEHVKSRIANRLVPAGLVEEFSTLRMSFDGGLERLQSELTAFDATLAKAAKTSTAKIRYQLAKLEQKAARETLRRDQRATADANYLIDSVYPHKHLQERFYSIVPFLAKYGWDLPQRLYEKVQLTCPHHMVRTV